MNKTFKKLFALLSTTAIAASMLVVPVSVNADEIVPLVDGDTVIKEWKFDFGSGEDVVDGYTAVTPDRNYVTAKDYGFIGIDEEGYKLGNRLDGFGNQEGQVIELAAGGGTGLNDGIGSVGEDIYGNAGDVYYPTRFALKVEDEQYFRIRATVTTLDPTKDAEISLYTERKHPIFTNETVAAGETKTVDFSIRTTPIYYEKSEPKGSIDDGMVNVCVLGENSALAALEIQQVETLPTFWVLGDSTVTDGNCDLPFFPLQNYTGVGTGLTKYLPSTMAMVNEGEGGLAAGDNNHFNMVKNRIKAGDYMYVEYGHNHKDDGPAGYLSHLDKYYNACHDVGANLIIVSPIERINTFSDNAYQHTLRGFAEVGEQYVADKVAAGATDIAYVDLNLYSLNLYNDICTDEEGNVDSGLIKFYFQTARGGSTDRTHPNDAGAENIAYEFFRAASAVTDETQQAVLAGFLNDMRDETPNRVSEEITSLGGPSNDAWPVYVVPSPYEHPVVIKNITFDDDGNVSLATVETRAAEITMTAYGIIVITVVDSDGTEKGKIYAVDQVDNSTGYGVQEISNFTTDITVDEDDTYSAVVMQALDTEDGLKVDEDANIAYSAVYVPTDIETHLITDEDGNGTEDFYYYGATYTGDEPTNLNGSNGWIVGGSSGKTTTLGVDGERYYANFIAQNGNSAYAMKKFDSSVGTTGRYMLEADLQYVSGGGMKVSFAGGIKNSSPFASDEILLYTVETNGSVKVNGVEAGVLNLNTWGTVKAILDMDAATVSVSVAGGTPVVAEISNYAKFTSDITPSSLAGISFNGSKTDVGIRISNLTAAKLQDDKAKTTINVAAAEGMAEMGTVSVGDEGATSLSVLNGTTVTAKVVANDGYVFKGWSENGTLFSEEEELSLRLYRDLDLTAEFAVATTPATVTLNYLDGDGKAIKTSETITEVDGEIIRTGDEFVLPSDKTAAIKVANGDLFEVYAYDSAASDSLTIASLAEANTINLVFAKQDGYYYIYEDFTTVTDDWGFVEGRSGNVNVLADGTLQIYAGSGTSTSQQAADVKTFDTVITDAKKFTVSFDWKSQSDTSKDRWSSFDLTDADGNIIISVYGGGKNGTTYAVNQSATKDNRTSCTNVASLSNQWIRVELNLDFEAMTVSGTVTNLSTGSTYTVAETAITATNLAQMKTVYGYSGAPQVLDNVSIKIDELPGTDDPVTPGMTYADGILSITAEEDCATAIVYVASYNTDGSLASVTLKDDVVLTAGDTSTVEVTANAGDKIMLWNGMSNIFDALIVTE